MELLANLQSYHACELLIAFAALLILVDYFFPTDWPAHLGYVCVALSVFFGMWQTSPGATWSLVPSLLLAGGVWIGLAVLHRVCFRRFLENAPGAEEPSGPGDSATRAVIDDSAASE